MTIEKVNAFLQDLKNRNLIYDCTNYEKLKQALCEGKKIYLGIDPTFHSLHLGHYLSLLLLKRFKKENFEPVILIGTMTAQIGDPSFRNSERPDLKPENIKKNTDSIKKQIVKLCGDITVIENSDFYSKLEIIDLLKEVTKNITVSSLLSKDFLKDRLQSGLTVTEFLYPVFQGYDFYHLFQKENVAIQIGGSDQWGNITVGIDLIKKKTKNDSLCVGLTTPLLVDENNKKFGKSEGNCCFLDPLLTKPYFLYRYLLNLSDIEVEKYYPKLSLDNLDDIEKKLKTHKASPYLREAQKSLSYEIVKHVHSEDIAKQLELISKNLFSYFDHKWTESEINHLKDVIPTIRINGSEIIEKVLILLGFSSSNSESRRLISSNCVYVFDKKCTNENYSISKENLEKNFVIIKKGKKDCGLVIFE